MGFINAFFGATASDPARLKKFKRNLIDLILGPFIGAVAGELTVHRDLYRAGRAGVAAWIGFALGTVVKVGMAFLMVAIFLAALLAF